ncbi:unnamed protein product, partial [Oppiella nova]
MADNRTKRSATKSTAQPMAAKSDTQKWNIPPQQRPLSSSSSTTPSAPLISSKTSAAIDALFDSGYDSQTVSKSSIDFDADFDSKCVISDAKSTSSMSATTTTSVADIDRKSAEHKWSDSGVSIATDSGLNLDEEFADQSAYDGDDSAGGLVGRSGGAVSLREAFTPDQDGDTYLHLAIIQGLADVAYALIRMAPDPDFLDATNHLSQTPLHLAALTGQSHIVRRLVISGATVDLRDRHGNTALHIACAQSDYTAVCQLISPIRDRELHSAHVVNYTVDSQHLPVHYLELRNYEGETSLHLAAYHKNKNIIELLVKCGVDVNAQVVNLSYALLCGSISGEWVLWWVS